MTTKTEEAQEGTSAAPLSLEETKNKYRGRRFRRVAELLSAVQELCAAEFLATWGHPLTQDGAGKLIDKDVRTLAAKMLREREARGVCKELRAVCQNLEAFFGADQEDDAAEYGGGNAVTALYRFVLPSRAAFRQLAVVLDVENMPLADFNYSTGRGELLRTALVESYRVARAPLSFKPELRSLTPRELAVVSLILKFGLSTEDIERIAAGASKKTGQTAAWVIEEETKRITQVLKAFRDPNDGVTPLLGK